MSPAIAPDAPTNGCTDPEFVTTNAAEATMPAIT